MSRHVVNLCVWLSCTLGWLQYRGDKGAIYWRSSLSLSLSLSLSSLFSLSLLFSYSLSPSINQKKGFQIPGNKEQQHLPPPLSIFTSRQTHKQTNAQTDTHTRSLPSFEWKRVNTHWTDQSSVLYDGPHTCLTTRWGWETPIPPHSHFKDCHTYH